MALTKSQIKHLTEQCGLLGRTIVVVGAGGTIGSATCRELAMRGAVVIPSRTTRDGVDESVALIQEAGGSSESCPGGFPMDLTDFSSIENGYNRLLDLTRGRITGIFCNAGAHNNDLVIGPEQHYGDIKMELVIPFFMTNVLGQAYFMQLLNGVTRDIKEFIGIANTTAACDGLSRIPHYRMAKAGLNELWEFFAVDHAKKYGHRYVVVEPGFVSIPKVSAEDQQNAFAIKDPVRFNAINNRIPLETNYVDGVEKWASGDLSLIHI